MLVLSSPSGAGKTTLAHLLLAAESNLEMSVSVTTRPPRPGETGGKDYHFVDQAGFEAMRASGALLEWATVFDNCYGTPRAPVEEALARGADVLFDIDWQGARQLYSQARRDVAGIFILPPARHVLEERLRRRAADPPDVVAKRLAAASSEISHWADYDYVLINDDLDASLGALRGILAAERLRRERQTGLMTFVQTLLA